MKWHKHAPPYVLRPSGDFSVALHSAFAVSGGRPTLWGAPKISVGAERFALATTRVGLAAYVTTNPPLWISPFTTSDGAGTGDFTMLAVAAPPLSATATQLLSSRNPTPSAYASLQVNQNGGSNASGALTLNTSDGVGNTRAAATSVLTGGFHVIAGRRSGTTCSVWVDGVSVGSISGTVRTVWDANARLSPLCAYNGGSGSFFGLTANCPYLLHGVWNRALADNEMAELGRDPWLLFEQPRQRIWVPVSAGAQIVTAGISAETDSAFGVTALKRLAIGLNTETDSGFAVARVKAKAVGLNTETDSGFALARFKVKTVGLNTETDAPFAVATAKRYAAGLNTETDTALPVSGSQAILAGLAEAIDTALAVTKRIAKAIGLTTETDEALPVANATVVPVGQASESDSAFSVAKLKRKLVGLAREFDSAKKVTSNATVSWGLKFPLIRPMVRNLIQSWRSRRFPWKEPF